MKKLILAAIVAVNVSACATVVNGTKDTLKIQSTPSDATVNIRETSGELTERTCLTPCAIDLKRKKSYDVTVSKDDRTPFSVLVEPKLSAGNVATSAGNVIAGGLIGLGVDHATGAGRDLVPNNFIVTLSPAGEASFATLSNGDKVGSSRNALATAATKTQTISDAAPDTANNNS